MNGDVRVTALPPVSEAATDRYERLCLSIAGIGFELAWAGAPPAQERSLKFYREFLSDRDHSSGENEINVRLRVHCGELPNLERETSIFDAVANHWRLFRSNGHAVFEMFHTLPPHPLMQVSMMAPDFSSGDVYVRPRKSGRWPTWSLLRVMRPFG